MPTHEVDDRFRQDYSQLTPALPTAQPFVQVIRTSFGIVSDRMTSSIILA